MFAYSHAYHAGNFADVLKHAVYGYLLDYLQQKPGSLDILDTHAGTGSYDLSAAASQKTQEWRQGIGSLPWPADSWPELLAPYARLLTQMNPDRLRQYPGSPLVAQRLLRGQDRLTLCEWQGKQQSLLKQQFDDPQVQVVQEDGLQRLAAIHSKDRVRQLVLVDPSYELKTDYQQLPKALAQALKRASTACILIWYPMLSARDHQPFVKALAKATGQLPACHVQHWPQPSAQGMQGSGLWVVNPPWTLVPALQQDMPWLNQQLAGAIGRWQVQTHG